MQLDQLKEFFKWSHTRMSYWMSIPLIGQAYENEESEMYKI